MSRRKRGRAQIPPKNQPERRDDVAATGAESGLRVELGGAELVSALRLEIAVTGPAPVAEPIAYALEADPAQPELLGPAGSADEPSEPAPPPVAYAAASEPADTIHAQVPLESEHRMEASAPVRALGLRFAEGRAALGLSIEEAARQLRIPAPALADIEAERFNALGPPIYARGFLRSYARLVKLPESALGHALASCEQADPDLQPAVSVQSRPISMRFATPALYALLTLLLVVPVALQLYQRSTAPSAQRTPVEGPAREVALDTPAKTGANAPAAEVRANEAPATGPAQVSAESAAPDEASQRQIPGTPPQEQRAVATQPPPHSAEPMLASLAPLPSRAVSATGQHVLLKLAESSWIELIGADGSRIEYAMLPAGTAREYSIAGKASLRIGNMRGASLFVDGRQLDLAEFSRGNVARVGLGEEPTTAAEGQ